MRALHIIAVFAVSVATVAGVTENPIGIIGGTPTTIQEYPYVAALLYSSDLTNYRQFCAGAVLNNRAVLSAANCFFNDAAYSWRIRVGSSYANNGGDIYFTLNIINHPGYNPYMLENDIAILHTSTEIVNSNIYRGSIAGPNYNIIDNQTLFAVGWGSESYSTGASPSEQMRQLQVNYINLEACRNIYVILSMGLSEDMICSGWLDVSGRDQCQGNSGGPLTHNKVIVGVTSWGEQCTLAKYPGVSTRISRYTSWIQSNA